MMFKYFAESICDQKDSFLPPAGLQEKVLCQELYVHISL